MATTMQRTTRQATPERWQGALRRALANGVQLRQIAGTGSWIATSSSRPALAYFTDGHMCDCEAFKLGGDPVCQHRALYWHLMGALGLDPEPPTPAAPALAVVPPFCPPCDGKGFVVKLSAIFGTTYRVTCRACSGAGVARKEAPEGIAA